MLVGLRAPIGRFISVPIRISEPAPEFPQGRDPPALGAAAHTLVLCARLPQPAGRQRRDALTGNPNFAGYLAIFGHGECYGGPGHCDLPSPRARSFDIRGRSHNTPRNHRIDVTEAANRLLASEQTLQITLVVIGADYREDKELLKLEGVSLNFLD